MSDLIVELNRRLTALEGILTDPVQQAIYGVFKSASATTQGNVYVQTTTKNLIATTTTEGNTNPIVIAAESMVDDVGYGMVWTKCVTMGLVWVNFESGLSPTPRDYVIASAEEGLAKTVSNSQQGAFGRLIRFDDTNNRGLVMVGGSGGGGSDDPVKWWRQAGEPTPQVGVVNLWYKTGNGHIFYYNDVDEAWYRLTGFMG